MSMCGICWFDGRALTDEIDDLRQRVKEAEAKAEVANKKGHDERSYDDPASGDAGDTPKTDALIEQWMRSPTPVPPEFISLCRKLERESYSKQETNAMLAENWTRTERLLAIALKENKSLWDGIEAIREKQLEKPRCPVCDRTLIDGDWCDNHGRINERLNPNDYR